MSAEALRALHVPGDPLVLPNAWDAATARLALRLEISPAFRAAYYPPR
ncbi:MAG TPA: hypothetical protein VFX51_05535 [Solirubrobacteraceae bacterium]|nr:hypothetical protein [Solirubrobacteraceae bacterium]